MVTVGTIFACALLACGPSATLAPQPPPTGISTGPATATAPLAGPGLAEPIRLEEVTYWGYQIQGVEAEGVVDTLVASHYDMLVLEPTRTDWSSDAKNFDTRGMVTRLKESMSSDGVHRKLVIAYIDIGETED